MFYIIGNFLGIIFGFSSVRELGKSKIKTRLENALTSNKPWTRVFIPKSGMSISIIQGMFIYVQCHSLECFLAEDSISYCKFKIAMMS